MSQHKSKTKPPSSQPNSAHTSAPAAIVRVGPAGWAYPDWAGYVYPSRRAKGFHEATYLAEYFDTIEINTSFYQPLRPEHAAQWLDRVAANPRFVFTAKLWQRFTHDIQSISSSSVAEDERAVRAGFDVLRAAKKLGAILLQFPFSFHRTAETVAYLSALIKRFADYPLVVEVRHGSWDSPETLELLRTSSVSFCNIDQPMIGRSLGPSAQATSAVGYVRLQAGGTTRGSRTTKPSPRMSATTIFTPRESSRPGSRAFAKSQSGPAKHLSSPTITSRAKPWSMPCSSSAS
jgi:uncharacterized protein YecE (DUF72 family)